MANVNAELLATTEGDTDAVYFTVATTNYGAGFVAKVSRAGGGVHTLVPTASSLRTGFEAMRAIAVDSQSVYWIGNGIQKVTPK